MKKSFFLSILLLVCFSLTSFSQFSIGPRFGLNMSSYGFNYEDSSDEPDTKFKIGPQFGAMFAYQFIDEIGLRTAIVYTMKGTVYNMDYTEIDNNGDRYTVDGFSRTTLNYLELPLDGTFGVKAGEVYIFGNVGPYFAVCFGGKSRWDYHYKRVDQNGYIIEEGYPEGDRRIKPKNEVSDPDYDVSYISSIDYGLNMGIGLKVNFFMFNIQYGLGLNNLTPHYTMYEDFKEERKRYNRGISVYFAFLFGKSNDEDK